LCWNCAVIVRGAQHSRNELMGLPMVLHMCLIRSTKLAQVSAGTEPNMQAVVGKLPQKVASTPPVSLCPAVCRVPVWVRMWGAPGTRLPHPHWGHPGHG
jgi:hypothetical protein